MEGISTPRVKVECFGCEHPMVLESNMDNHSSIYFCEICRQQVKITNIANRGGSP